MTICSSGGVSSSTVPGYIGEHVSINEIQRDLKVDAQNLLASVIEYLKGVENSDVSFDFGDVSKVDASKGDFKREHTGINNMPGLFSGNVGPYSVPTADINDIAFNDIADIGEYNGFVYAPNFIDPPVIDNPLVPEDFSGDTNIDVPAEVVLGVIIEPDFQSVVIPNINTLSIPDFTAVAPGDSSVSAPTDTFTFTEIDYTSSVLEQADSLIQQMMVGGVGIPEVIWNRIWERAGTQVDQSLKKQIEEINADWASRNFSLPQGVQVAQIAEARQEAFNKKAELARDNAIAYSQEEIKNLQFAVQQGIAFETMRGGWHQQIMQRTFEVAKTVFDTSIKLFEANISMLNFRLQKFKVEAEVYKTVIDAEVAKLEESRLAIQAQELTIKTNDSLVSEYNSRIAAAKLDIDLYNARINAVNLKIESIKADVSIYSERIKAYGETIKASSTKADIYKTQVDAEDSKVNAYETSVRAFSEELRGYEIRTNAENVKTQSKTKIEELKLQKLDSQIKAFVADLSARTDIYKVELDSHKDLTHQAELLMKDNQFKTTTELSSDSNVLKLLGEESRIAIANAQLAAKEIESSVTLAKELNKSAAEIAAGLAGSIYSAIHVSASESNTISHGTNETSSTTCTDSSRVSNSVSHNYNYDGGSV